MLTQHPTDSNKIIGQVSAMAMVDEDFKSRLLAHPEPVLEEYGLDIQPNMKVEILTTFDDVPEDRDPSTVYLVIPEAEELSDDELSIATVAAASCQSTASSACTTPSCLSSASTASTQSCS